MKKPIIFLFCCICFVLQYNVSYSQTGSLVYTIAGNGTSGYSGDGGTATAASLNQVKGVCQDKWGNIYITDVGSHTVRKISSVTGIISTIAGNGTRGYSGDGGPAVSATLNSPQGIACDASGNIFIADGTNQRIRKIDAATGIITTVAGNGTPVLSGDGGPATSAGLKAPINIYVDENGNLYICPWTGSDATIRKVDALTGIITSIAGMPGPVGYSGDGGPATNAKINSPCQVVIDNSGNLYFADNGTLHVRKIDASGIITTIAGNGTTTLVDGVPATATGFINPRGLAMDCYGNILVGDHGHHRVRKIDAATGIITTIAGGGSSLPDGVPATAASILGDFLMLDVLGNITYADGFNRLRKITNYFPGMVSSLSDSFLVHVDKLCAGPQFYIKTVHYHSSMSVKTYYGDRNIVSTPVEDGFGGGYAVIAHNYQLPGVYSIKHVLFSGSMAVDSFLMTYDYAFCKTLTARFYYDANGNCAKEINEPYILQPVSVQIDSNGTAIDTVSTTSGFNYSVYGLPGDVYTMKVVAKSPGLANSCPTSGILNDTLQSAKYSNEKNDFAFNCSATPGFDLKIKSTFRGTSDRARGDIIVANHYCSPKSGVVTLNMSPKYIFNSASPAPATIVGSTITWNFSGLSSETSVPMHIHYTLVKPTSAPLYLPGDTVNSNCIANPYSGDLNPPDNNVIRIDTVRSSFDPNYVEVSPEGQIVSGTELTYTIGFENTGNDTAHNIYVLDTLSDNLNSKSLEVITASAPMEISSVRSGPYTILKFDFPNIMLPDSTHHDLCHGMFMFKIKAKDGLPNGTKIYNQAGIYFDINPVVMTNSVENIICNECTPTGLQSITESKPTIYPNPATDEFIIKTNRNTYNYYTVTNSMGQVMMQQQINATQTKVDVKLLPAGLYYVMLKGEHGTLVQKVVKAP